MILSSSVIVFTILTHIIIANLLNTSIIQYWSPWGNGSLPSPWQRLGIATGSTLVGLTLVFSLDCTSIHFEPLSTNSTDKTVIHSAFDDIQDKAYLTLLKNLHHVGLVSRDTYIIAEQKERLKHSRLKTAAHMCLDELLYLLLPFPPLDGGSLLIAIIGIARGKPLSRQAVQSLTILGFLTLMLWFVLQLV